MITKVAIIGGGPAGLMAAEVLSAQGIAVTMFEAMPTVGRKFLLAGKSGLNLTHSEAHDKLLDRFSGATDFLRPALDAFPANDIQAWANGLGTETFTGSSGRVFPTAMKASPLLRSWLARLKRQGVSIFTRHRFTRFSDKGVLLDTPQGALDFACDAVLLALGGASWPKLGSDATWVSVLRSKNIDIAPFRPANCGFEVNWSVEFKQRFAGAPVKAVTAISDAGPIQGEFVVTNHGIEGSLIYAHSATLRDRLESGKPARLVLDLVPGRSVERLARDLARQKPKDTFSSRLRKGTGLDGVKVALLRECVPNISRLEAASLANTLKAMPLPLVRPRPIEEAISSAGGIKLNALNEDYMLRSLPGVFAAGEMIDWEAPTGGYLLTACLATGRAAAESVMRYIQSNRSID